MKKSVFSIISLICLFYSCTSDKTEKNIQPKIDEGPMCTFDLINPQNNDNSKPASAIITWPRWQTGQIIKIKFLDGNEMQREKAKKHASEWLNYANLKFEYVSTGYADIRIGFDRAGESGTKYGAWSELGMSSAYGFNLERQSMRLGPLTSADESSIRRTVLHEFGHALGLVHETTNPNANIKWNLSKVYNYFNEYSKEEVDEMIINPDYKTNYSAYDPLSIMHYYIPASITTDGRAVNEMTLLSEIDKKSINGWYPFPIVSVLKSGQSIYDLAWKDRIKSPSGRYALEFTPGVLRVVDLTENKIIWEVGNKEYNRKAFCYFESNGNITLRGAKNPFSAIETIWTSNTSEYPEATLQLQDDGNLQLIYKRVVKWSSKTGKI
ncbi:matrixin family metalloprotease [Flavobacterium sp. SH_e]|uniref:matrixin family metalloprotease n=1 Tax=Flavobacterium TaxID=237 RepID=UPI0021E489E4|nr:matrixin family metalloprotease [Flavobacterium sp. SH_e]MCV2486537.1 matrixin family metalloprotease [Flavobacterium sp. SH_e]